MIIEHFFAIIILKSSIGGAGYCGIEIKVPGHLVRYIGKVVSLNADGYAAHYFTDDQEM